MIIFYVSKLHDNNTQKRFVYIVYTYMMYTLSCCIKESLYYISYISFPFPLCTQGLLP